jgi:beta-hydroxylase
MDLENYVKGRDSFAVRFGKRVRWPLNRFLARQSLIGAEPFFEPEQVPGLDLLRDNWETIRDEVRVVMADRETVPPLGRVSPDHRRIASTSAWKSFFFTGYGYRAKANRARCPKTAALLDRVPNLVVAFFSIFEPGTHVVPHHGVTTALLNVHLALLVPEGPGRCEIRVEDKYRGWMPGEYLVFDETFQHEVWNETNEPRVVLFLQVLRPMRWRGRWLGKLFLWCVKRTTFVQDIRRNLDVG